MPFTNSGLTSVVLVTVPLKLKSFPSLSHLKSLTLANSLELIQASKET